MFRVIKGLALFAIGLGVSLIVGWWLTQRQRQQAAPDSRFRDVSGQTAVSTAPAIVLPPEAFEGVEPLTPEHSLEGVSVAASVESSQPPVEAKDDLTQLKGIGPKKAEALAGIGIATFSALAAADAQDLKNRLPQLTASVGQFEAWIAAARERVEK